MTYGPAAAEDVMTRDAKVTVQLPIAAGLYKARLCTTRKAHGYVKLAAGDQAVCRAGWVFT